MKVVLTEQFFKSWRRINSPWHRFKTWLHDLLFPKQKWLTKKIPRNWCDKTELIPTVLFTMVVDFVEKEKAFDSVVDWDSDEHHKKFFEEISAVYYYITVARPEMEKNINHFDDLRQYGTSGALELKMDELDTKHCLTIVKNRRMMWI